MLPNPHHTSLILILSLPLLAHAQTATTGAAAAVASPDGLIVPFSSDLPACASLCGQLWNVQGACTPPHIASVSSACFCSDARLTPFLQSTAEVESICGPASCQDASDLGKIQKWYESYCNVAKAVSTSTSSGSTATGTAGDSSSSKPASSTANTNNGWFATHWKWVVFLIVVFFGLLGVWGVAVLLRRRYLRKKEKQIEMRPPVAWGPHQMQGATGGYGDGVVDARGAAAKEAKGQGWLKKDRN